MFKIKRLLTRPNTTESSPNRLALIEQAKQWQRINQQRYASLVAHTRHPDELDAIQLAQLRYFNRLHQQRVKRYLSV